MLTFIFSNVRFWTSVSNNRCSFHNIFHQNFFKMNTIKRPSGLVLNFHNENFFSIAIDKIPADLSMEHLLKIGKFKYQSYIKNAAGHISFEKYVPPLKVSPEEILFLRSAEGDRLNRNEVISLHISNNMVGFPLGQLFINSIDDSFVKKYPSTAFFGSSEGAFFQTTCHVAETKTIEGKNFDFSNCLASWNTKTTDWFCGVDKKYAEKYFQYYL